MKTDNNDVKERKKEKEQAKRRIVISDLSDSSSNYPQLKFPAIFRHHRKFKGPTASEYNGNFKEMPKEDS